MKETFINSDEDMAWLRDVHLPNLSHSYKSAVIFGNEDYPDQIEVYEKRDPEVSDRPVTYQPDDTKRDLVYRKINPMRRSKRSSRHVAGGLSTGQKVAIGAAGVAVLFVVGSLVMASTASASEGPTGASGPTGATGPTGGGVGLTGPAAGMGRVPGPQGPASQLN